MSNHTRRRFLGAAGALAGLSAPAGAQEGSESDVEEDTRIAGPVSATVSWFLEDRPLGLSDYPDDTELGEGTVHLFTHGEDVHFNVGSETVDRSMETGITLTPDAADQAAALLQEFAEYAREGEGKVYP